MKFDFVKQIIEIAAQEAAINPHPKERCGVIVREGAGARLIECQNVSQNPCEEFKFDPEEWAFLSVDHEIIALWHTHPNGSAAPSEVDRRYIERTALPWHIVSWPEGGHSYTEPTGYEVPYVGRPFVHGVHDCYGLVRDWYRREAGLHLTDYPRDVEWWDKGQNLYVDNFEKEGFRLVGYSVKNLERGDLILMQIRSKVPNHAAIYVGDGKILHHLHSRLSGIFPFGGQWQKSLTHILRHESRL